MIDEAFEDGYGFASELRDKYDYSAQSIRDAATTYVRDTYALETERHAFDDGVAVYLNAAFGRKLDL